MITITMENGKEIKLELYPDVAPATVENFEKLVKDNIADDGRKTRAYSLINRLYYNLDNK